MNALNEKLPDIISDEQGYKKAKRELDKTVFDLDNADRLEKQGYTKEAIAEKEKAADRGANLWHYMSQYQAHIKGTELTSSATRYAAEKNLEGDKIKAAATSENTRALHKGADEAKAFNQATILKREVNDVHSDIEKEKNNTNSEYAKLTDKINTYSQMANRTSEQDVALADFIKRKGEIDAAHKKRITTAEQNAKLAEQRYLNMTGGKPTSDTATTTAAPNAATTAAPPEGLPEGSKAIGKDKKTGATVYEAPDGKRYIGT
jgi:hypothetical protein